MNNFDEFWRDYPGRKVAKPKCKEKYDKLTDEEHKEVILGIQAQIRYRSEAHNAREFVPEWCNSQTFINQQRWYDEIGSHAELKEKAIQRQCSIEGCSEPVHTPKGKNQYCYRHYSFDSKGNLRDELLLVEQLRDYYRGHKEIHDLRGRQAFKYIRYKIGGIGKI